MENKAIDLLEKMYNEFTDFRKETSSRFDILEVEVKSLKKDVLRIEDNHGRKLEALFDGYKQHDMKLEVIEQKVDTLSEKVDSHDLKIQFIEERGK